MKNRNWEIVYSSATGVELRALELLYGELGNYILREPGAYAFHTLKCARAEDGIPVSNAFVIGTIENNPVLKRFITEADIPEHGFCIRVIPNPEADGKQLVLIAGAGSGEVLYGVCAFFDDVLPQNFIKNGDGIYEEDEVFSAPLALTDYKDAPQSLVRSIFTWAHPVGDYRDYIQNAARMRINRFYFWNEYPPVNAAEIVDYAHSWGIEVFWGFAWGWSENCREGAALNLDTLRGEILKDWRERWSKLPCDGIYFQSFTEMTIETVDGRTVADMVTELVNSTSKIILEDRPDLRIVYGLHAMSVSKELKTIAKTDNRIKILWEDCGGFPYRYSDFVSTRGDKAFTKEILDMPNPKGLLFKCLLLQQWKNFVHQAGPYILGMNGKKMQAHDIAVASPLWRHYEMLWAEHGEKAREMADFIHRNGGIETELGTAAQINGPIHWPMVLMARLFWGTNESYRDLVKKSMVCNLATQQL